MAAVSRAMDRHANQAIVDVEQFYAPALLLHLRADFLYGAAHALVQRMRMDAVQHHQPAEQRIAAQMGQRIPPRLAAVAEHFDDAGQPRAVQVHQRLHEFERSGARVFLRYLVDALNHALDLFRVRLKFAVVHLCPITPNIGECRVSSTLPLPRYMCTPHGRQGSKLRTARMMSMPLNLSGPFSSKMGVFCTASSYGPGVP